MWGGGIPGRSELGSNAPPLRALEAEAQRRGGRLRHHDPCPSLPCIPTFAESPGFSQEASVPRPGAVLGGGGHLGLPGGRGGAAGGPLAWAQLGICVSDHQKLEREARICRLLKHPNIGEWGMGEGAGGWRVFAGCGGQLLSFRPGQQQRGERGVGAASTPHSEQLGCGEGEEGPLLPAHAAGSLLQKSCFWKAPEALRAENRPSLALTSAAHSPGPPPC